jgi:hypothetical protein
MFDNNFEKLKNIFDCIGLEYDDTTFDNSEKKFKHNNESYINDFNTTYRVWQINQPIQNMNSEIDVPLEITERLLNNEVIKKLGYTN